MASATSYRAFAAALIAIALTAPMVWFGYSLNPWWPLMWFAPLPVLVFGTRARWWTAALTAAIAWFLGCLTLWNYFHQLQMPVSVFVRIFSGAAAEFALAVLLFRALLRRGATWSALLAFPCFLVVAEYVRNLTSSGGTAGSFAYMQLNFLPFLQLASITGPWGMTFLLLLFPAALVIGIYLRPTAPRQALRIVGASLGVIIIVLIFGAVRLALPPPPQFVKVGLIASDIPSNEDVAENGAPTERLFRDYSAEAEKLAAQGAQVIVLPEKLGVLVDQDTVGSDAIFQSLADKTKATIVVGMVYVSGPVRYNRARIYTPRAPIRNYDKHHMLPPFESKLTPGTTATILPESSPLWGVEICKDMDFTQLSREYGEAHVGLILAPAWDFRIDRWWHGHIAVMRGVEDGFGIARAAKDGYLTASDNRGRIVAETRSDSAPFATLIADVPTTHDATLYLLLGDWFAWLAIAMLAFACIQLFRARPRIQSSQAETNS